MAPSLGLTARDYIDCSRNVFGSVTCRRRSSWSWWGRWVLAGIAIFLAIVLLFSCICVSRKRRKAGTKPVYGTGWIGQGGKWGHNNNQQHHQGHQMNNYQGDQNQGGYNPPQYGGYNPNSPPPYGVPPPVDNQATGTTFNPNDGYYGAQQYGVQQPSNTYQRDANYAPPNGPPPGK